MKPSEGLALHREAILVVVESHKAHSPRVFGSVVRGEDTEDSDLDLLVEPKSGMSLYDLSAMAIALEVLLGVKVDVMTLGFVHPYFRADVLAEAQPI